MCAKATEHPSNVRLAGVVLFYAVASVALLFLILMVSALFMCAAEAFFGEKDPLLETMLGFFVGTFIASGLGGMLVMLTRYGLTKLAWAILITIIAFDAAVIPFCGWLIRQARAAPKGVIDLW